LPNRAATIVCIEGLRWQEDAALKTWIATLVVEDDALIRFDLAQTLEAQGYKTFDAADAEEAIAVLERHSEIAVVFTDIQMPGTMDGLALSRYVRKRWPPTILVVSSGHCTPTQEEMASGALFIPKPYPPQMLTEVLDNIREQIG
jgi:DNA-binding NtrC family response regulator